MSQWTDIRDGVLSQINADAITSQFKEDLYNKVVEEFLPFIKQVKNTRDFSHEMN